MTEVFLSILLESSIILLVDGPVDIEISEVDSLEDNSFLDSVIFISDEREVKLLILNLLQRAGNVITHYTHCPSQE